MSGRLQVWSDAANAVDAVILNDVFEKKGSNELDSYLNTNKTNFLESVEQSKYANANLVFGGAAAALQNQLNTYSYFTRNKDVNNLISYPLDRMRNDAQGLKSDNANAQRQYEINQWTSGNRADTLFVYQIIFVIVLVLSILTGIWRMGYISTGLLSFAVFGSIAAIVLIIVARAQYTAFQRNKRYWNKRQFPRLAINLSASGPNCPSASDILGEFDYDKLKARVKAGTAEYRGDTANFLRNMSSRVNNLAGTLA